MTSQAHGTTDSKIIATKSRSLKLELLDPHRFCYTELMNNQTGIDQDIHSEAFLCRLMRRQLRLSIICAATFLIALFGLPLANYFFPEFMARRILGFTLTWFILGVVFFPLVWAIAWVFIKRSIALEEAEVRAMQAAGMEIEKAEKWKNQKP